MVNNIDLPKIKQKIIFMQSNLNKLRKLQKISKDIFIEDFRNVDSAKYLLQVTIEAMLDISNHIIARNRMGKPKTNKESFEILAKENIIDRKYVNIYFAMAKFRNRIVHIYSDVNDEMIYEITQNNLEDFEAFIQTIIKNINL
ncbi:type VII toxin-antitoxin system HepT family RNase toxin [Clostridium sp. WILCCON 0269]|uniref:Type VII toxin-antitoxin system HepT family RNase toxin n=1 Tax=Candidatus Clostridium eludens TaxID=3381663 RepID=A0ABW8SLJ9_9CLOT